MLLPHTSRRLGAEEGARAGSGRPLTSDLTLVTGAGGFIGRHVVTEAERRGWDLLVIAHSWSSSHELSAALGDAPVTRCIHLGWYADPVDYLTAVEPNLRSLQNSLDLFSLLMERGCRHLVVAGSSAEYAPSPSPHDEFELVTPWSVYGSAKAALHLFLDSSWRPSSMGLAWARLFNVTGPFEHRRRLLPTVTRSLLQGEPIDLSPGEQRRDFLDVTDAAGALVALSDTAARGTFNVCSGQGTSLRHLLGAIAQRTGDASLLRFGARPYHPREAMSVVGSNQRLRQATGWGAHYDAGAVIERVVEHWEKMAMMPESVS